MMTAMRRHFSVGPANLSHTMVSRLMDNHRKSLALLGIGMHGRGLLIVEIIADPVASENFRRYHLRVHGSLLIAQKKSVHSVGPRPELRRWNCDGRPRSSGGTAESEGGITFGSDHARVWQRPRTFFDDNAFEGATSQQQGNKKRSEKIGTHRRGNRRTRNESVCTAFPVPNTSKLFEFL
jgi:hypothetical protein